jgi:glucose/arabinose dehydrogenase
MNRIPLMTCLLLLLLGGCAGPSDPTPSWVTAAADGIPPGFALMVYAEGLDGPRFMAFGPDTGAGPNFEIPPAALYVTAIRAGEVVALPDRNQDVLADDKVVFTDGLRSPHGIAWHDGWLYVGETHQVIRLRDTNGDLRADEREVVVPNLPGGEQHFTRTVGFGPDGGLYVSVGSSCDVCKESDPRRAAILRFEPDKGGETTIYARGLRNAVGFTWHPETGEMWATDNGRDWLGDDLPPEELDLIQAGDDHGWPYCYGDRIPDPDMGSEERCAETQPATFDMPAHSAPLGLEFYTGEAFPAEYRGDLFIAFHGSWNRSVPTGYKVVRVRFREGRPVAMEDFVDVWLVGLRVRHRPVDVKTGPDGALYISDDRGGTIFRLAHAGGRN